METKKQCCENCDRYDLDRSFCKVEKRNMLRRHWCGNYKVRLADHYVPNPWDEWKRKAERKVRL